MLSRPSPRLSVTLLVTILASILATLVGLLGNLATSNIPSVITSYLRFAWPALGVVVLLGIGVSVWQVRRDVLTASPLPPAQQKTSPPSPTSILQQQHAPSDYQSCVLSYATKDQAFAEKLYTDLLRCDVPYWFAPRDLKTSDKLRAQIYKTIRKQGKLLLILSKHAVTSDWVEREVELLSSGNVNYQKHSFFFPFDSMTLCCTPTQRGQEDIRRIRFIGDFRAWLNDAAYQQTLQRLLRDLHA